jgi:hypothetical protein
MTSVSFPIIDVSPNPEFSDKPVLPMPFGSGIPREIGLTPPGPGFIIPPGATTNFPSPNLQNPAPPVDRVEKKTTPYPKIISNSLAIPDLIQFPNNGRPLSYTEQNWPTKQLEQEQEQCDAQLQFQVRGCL